MLLLNSPNSSTDTSTATNHTTYSKQSLKSTKRKVKKPLREAATYEDLQTILYSKRLKTHSQYMHARFVTAGVILFFTGMRISEVSSLTKEQVEGLKHTQKITVTRTKTHDFHTYHSSMKGSEILCAPIFNTYADIVFKRGEILRGTSLIKSFTRSFNKYMTIYLKPMHTNPVSSHSFRIGQVTNLLSAGRIPIENVSRLIGHKHIETTTRYYRFTVSPEIINQINMADLRRESAYLHTKI